MATSSLTFSGPAFVQARNQADPTTNDGMTFALADANKISLSFWIKVDQLPSSTVSPISLFRWGGLFCRVDGSGVSFNASYANNDNSGYGEIGTPTRVTIQLATWTKFMVVWDFSTSSPISMKVYKDPFLVSNVTDVNGPKKVSFNNSLAQLIFGNWSDYLGTFSDGVLSLADIAIWRDYAATSQDVMDLLGRTKTPGDISPSNLKIWFTGDGGTLGQNVQSSDSGITNNGDSGFSYVTGFQYLLNQTWNLGSGNSIQQPGGSLTYGTAPAYVPPIYATPHVFPSGEILYFIFKTKNGNNLSKIPHTATRANVTNYNPTISIARHGGGVDNATLTHVWLDNSTNVHTDGSYGAPYLFYNLLAAGLAPIDPQDVVTVTCQRDWTQTVGGSVDSVSTIASMESVCTPVNNAHKNLRLGVNIQYPWGIGLPYWSNWYKSSHSARPYASNGSEDWGMVKDATTNEFRPGPSGGWVIAPLKGENLGMRADYFYSRGPMNQFGEHPLGTYYGNAGQGTANFTPGWGYSMLPKRGKIHVVWDYEDGQSTGDCRILLGLYGTDQINESLENQLQSWSQNPAITNGSNGQNYYRTYTFTRNDPLNGLGSTGDPLTPTLSIKYNGYVKNIRITVEADNDLNDAQWNVDKFNPPLLNKWFLEEPLGNMEWLRFMAWTGSFDSGITRLEDYTPYDHSSWGYAWANPSYWWGNPTNIAITSVTPYTEPDATTLRTTYPGEIWGGFPVKLTTQSAHNLKAGCTYSISWTGLQVAMTGVKDGGGSATVDAAGKATWTRIARPISATELVTWLAWENHSDGQYGILDRTYSGAELGSAQIGINRSYTVPPKALGDFARETGSAVHWCLNIAIALDPTETARVAAEIASNYVSGRKFRLEIANEIWNFSPPYGNSLRTLRDACGIGNDDSAWSYLVDLTRQCVRTFRQAWQTAGMNPTDVDALISVGPGLYMGTTVSRIQHWNTTGDPLDRIGEVSVNTYYYNFGEGGGQNMSQFTDYTSLTVDQSLDILELQVKYAAFPWNYAKGVRDYLNSNGLSDVIVSSYEGSLEKMTVGERSAPTWDVNDVSTQAACAQLGLFQAAICRSPRLLNILQNSLQRYEDGGMVILEQFSTGSPWQSGNSKNEQGLSYTNWFYYTSYGEQAGTGDGLDGKYSNIVSNSRPWASVNEGTMVSVYGKALQSWNQFTNIVINPPKYFKKPSAALRRFLWK